MRRIGGLLRRVLATLIVGTLVSPGVRAGDLRNFEDAALHAVQFVDNNEGWAVGDEGVVWHSIDGGLHWERQSTGVRASLRGVHFLNPYVGWAVGREEGLYQTGSVGVMLYTRDGGLKWQRWYMNVLPGLNGVHFVDGQTGYAFGDTSDRYPTGLFRTTDAGRTWQSIAGMRYATWLAADFQDRNTGVLVGAGGTLAILRGGVLARPDVEPLGGRTLAGVSVEGKRALAVGAGGLVLRSRDSAGARWGFTDLKLSAEVLSCCDFQSVCQAGDQAWVFGRPGSAILHSPDGGGSWEVQKTGQPLPLHAGFFRDSEHGWVVGEFGSILRTVDGGKNWRVQHRGGQQAALLFVNARSVAVPLDIVALLGGEEGYLATGLAVTTPLAATGAENVIENSRFNQALRQAGGAAGEMLARFPLPQHLARSERASLLNAWDPAGADKAAEELIRHLVLALRIWRPSVVVTDATGDKEGLPPVDAVIAEGMHQAFQRAADPTAYPEQIEYLGLHPWEISKSYSRWNEPGSGAQVTMDTTTILPRLQSTARDFATPVTALLANEPARLPSLRYFHLLDSRISGAIQHRYLMQGIELAPGGVARRLLPEIAELAPEFLKVLETRRTLQTMAEMGNGPLSSPERLLAQIGPMTASMPDDQAAPTIFAVANQNVRMGQWSLAVELFLLMVERYPAHPLSVHANRWLIRHASSGEARRRHELRQFWVESKLTFRDPPNLSSREDRVVQAGSKGIQTKDITLADVTSREVGLINSVKDVRQWFQGSLALEPRLAAFGPSYVADPAVQFCLQSARRRLGEFEQASQWYTRFHADSADGPWRQAAGAEIWLTHRNGNCPKALAFCRQAATRPYLDGVLDEECWQTTKPLPMLNAAGDTRKTHPTDVRLAYDQEFLYLAIDCKHPAEEYVAPVKSRQHDTDLRPYDRVSLLLDIDRDYSTYYHLQVDQRGCVCDDCWGDRTWDPNWFVACKSDKTGWRVEAAIPLNQLTGDPVTLGRTWACNVARILPGRGIQAWSVPAEVEPRPEGMGLLMFMEAPKPAPGPLTPAKPGR